jgi:hypothetical protein
MRYYMLTVTHNLYFSPSIIRMIKSRKMRLLGHIAHMGQRGVHIGHWWESHKERDHKEDKDAGGWIILKWILERQDGAVWTGLIWLRIGHNGGLLWTW